MKTFIIFVLIAAYLCLPGCDRQGSPDIYEASRDTSNAKRQTLGFGIDAIELVQQSVDPQFSIKRVGEVGDSLVFAGLFSSGDASLEVLTDRDENVIRYVMYVSHSNSKHREIAGNLLRLCHVYYETLILAADVQVDEVRDNTFYGRRVVISRDSTGYLIRAELPSDTIIIPGPSPNMLKFIHRGGDTADEGDTVDK